MSEDGQDPPPEEPAPGEQDWGEFDDQDEPDPHGDDSEG